MKRFISSLLAGVLITGLATSASAQTAEQSRFLTSLDATSAQLAREYAVVSSYSSAKEIALLQSLSETAYEMAVELSAEVFGQSVGIAQNSRMHYDTNRFSSSTSIWGLQSLFFVPEIAFDIFANNDKVAVGSPALSNYYFYLQRNITADRWRETELYEQGISFHEIMEIISAVQMFMESQSLTAFDLDMLENFLDPYIEVVRNQLPNARFRSQGDQLVPTQRGNLRTEKITATFNAALISNIFNDLADAIENDEGLRNLLTMAMQGPATAFVDVGIRGAADVFRAMAEEFTGSVDLDLYIATNGMAVRQVVTINLGDILGSNVVLGMDLLGEDFLINDMALYMALNVAGQEVFFANVRQVGNNIMRGGITEGTMYLQAEILGYFTAGLVIDYFWDTNLTEDNFIYDMVFEMYSPELGLEEPFSFTMTWKGAYFTDLDNKVFVLDSVITGNWGELFGDPNASARLFVGINAIDPGEIGISGTGINVLEIDADSEELILNFLEMVF